MARMLVQARCVKPPGQAWVECCFHLECGKSDVVLSVLAVALAFVLQAYLQNLVGW